MRMLAHSQHMRLARKALGRWPNRTWVLYLCLCAFSSWSLQIFEAFLGRGSESPTLRPNRLMKEEAGIFVHKPLWTSSTADSRVPCAQEDWRLQHQRSPTPTRSQTVSHPQADQLVEKMPPTPAVLAVGSLVLSTAACAVGKVFAASVLAVSTATFIGIALLALKNSESAKETKAVRNGAIHPVLCASSEDEVEVPNLMSAATTDPDSVAEEAGDEAGAESPSSSFGSVSQAFGATKRFLKSLVFSASTTDADLEKGHQADENRPPLVMDGSHILAEANLHDSLHEEAKAHSRPPHVEDVVSAHESTVRDDEHAASDRGEGSERQPNLVLTVKSSLATEEPGSQASGVECLMSQPGGEILAAMAGKDWKVEPLDPSRGTYELQLPPVTYNMGVGSVTIPPPRFIATIEDSTTVTGDEHERLVGELVLQNGDRILTVDLGFPLNTNLSLSTEGSAKARIGRIGDSVFLQADVEIGLFLPKVPGLQKLMEMFIKAYANQSTQDCARALAQGADRLHSEAESSGRSGVAAALTTAALAASELESATIPLSGARVLANGAELELASQSPELLNALPALDGLP
mmetsp:Transcript_69730/g.167399  ORF Transcript_69730/g.167399 Transcript_69730/m.167399 type:complete len:578 (-) Transcript_69730:206-1939(-)